MDTQNPSAPPRAQTRIAGKNHPQRTPLGGGLTHDNTRHTTRFTVIGNHLAQHPELSLLAIGLGVPHPVAAHRRPRCRGESESRDAAIAA